MQILMKKNEKLFLLFFCVINCRLPTSLFQTCFKHVAPFINLLEINDFFCQKIGAVFLYLLDLVVCQ